MRETQIMPAELVDAYGLATDVDPEFAVRHKRIMEAMGSALTLGEELEGMRCAWPKWTSQQRGGYSDFYREYLPKAVGQSRANATVLMQSAVMLAFLIRNCESSLLPANTNQFRAIGRVLTDGGWLLPEDKQGNPKPRSLSDHGKEKLMKSWEAVVERAVKTRNKKEKDEKQEAMKDQRETKPIPPAESFITARFIEETPKVVSYVGSNKIVVDGSKYGVITRRLDAVDTYLDDLWQKYDGDLKPLAEKEKWTKGKKDAIRKKIAETMQCMMDFDEAVKLLRGLPE